MVSGVETSCPTVDQEPKTKAAASSGSAVPSLRAAWWVETFATHGFGDGFGACHKALVL